MLRAEIVSGNTLRLTLSGELTADDFAKVAPQVDSVISRYGKIRALIDASGFSGWEDLKAFESHVGFIKNHQDKVDRIAAIVAHKWQHWFCQGSGQAVFFWRATAAGRVLGILTGSGRECGAWGADRRA